MKDYKLEQHELERVHRLFMSRKFSWAPMIFAIITLIFYFSMFLLPVGITYFGAEIILAETRTAEELQELRAELNEMVTPGIVFGFIAPGVALITFLVAFPKFVSKSLQSGKYNCTLGTFKNKARSRRSRSIYINEDSLLTSTFASNAVNRAHYNAARPGDEIFMLRVLWMRYAIVKRLI